MARRKLEGTLNEYEQDNAMIHGYEAEESMEETYHLLRKKLGARHPLTIKAEQAMKRINDYRCKLMEILNQ